MSNFLEWGGATGPTWWLQIHTMFSGWSQGWQKDSASKITRCQIFWRSLPVLHRTRRSLRLWGKSLTFFLTINLTLTTYRECLLGEKETREQLPDVKCKSKKKEKEFFKETSAGLHTYLIDWEKSEQVCDIMLCNKDLTLRWKVILNLSPLDSHGCVPWRRPVSLADIVVV